MPRELVWAASTKPEHIVKWFTPSPWVTTDCEINHNTRQYLPHHHALAGGKDFPNIGCYLEVVPNERLVWTDALLPGYRPSEKPFFTAIIALEKQGKGTRYTATAIHRDEAGRKQHEEMGFHTGWGKALDQLVAHVKTM